MSRASGLWELRLSILKLELCAAPLHVLWEKAGEERLELILVQAVDQLFHTPPLLKFSGEVVQRVGTLGYLVSSCDMKDSGSTPQTGAE